MMIYVTGETVIDKMSGLIRNYPFLDGCFYSDVFTSWYTTIKWLLGKVLIGQGAIEGGHFVLLGLGFSLV